MKDSSRKEELKWYEKKRGINQTQKKRQQEYKVQASIKQQNKIKEELYKKEEEERRTRRSLEAKKHRTQNLKAECINSLFEVSSVPQDAAKILNDFDSIISSNHPLNSKQRAELPKDIRELSHYLTDERGERRLGYMNQTSTLSAYIHYYLWWNLVRLTRLFANLPSSFFNLSDESICLDIGSGPLTVPIALYMARPELRSKKLTWYCMDLSKEALSIGENLLLSVSARLQGESWKIVRVKGELGTSINQKADLITCANVFNEIVQDNSMPPDYLAKKYSEKILSYINTRNERRAVLIIEPGVPQSSRFVSLMRDALIRKSYSILSPCPHMAECPMDGKKGGKWCNYAFSTEDAPAALKKLSESARLPKERAVLSFTAAVFDGSKDNEEKETDRDKAPSALKFRIASDPIRLPGQRTGYYACSQKGLLLVITDHNLYSGQCYRIREPRYQMNTDAKSGALILNLE